MLSDKIKYTSPGYISPLIGSIIMSYKLIRGTDKKSRSSTVSRP